MSQVLEAFRTRLLSRPPGMAVFLLRVVPRQVAGNRGTKRVLRSPGACASGGSGAVAGGHRPDHCRHIFPRNTHAAPGLESEVWPPGAPAGRKKAPFFSSAHTNAIKPIGVIALLGERGSQDRQAGQGNDDNIR